MKRTVIVICLAISLILALTGCGASTHNPAPTPIPTQAPTEAEETTEATTEEATEATTEEATEAITEEPTVPETTEEPTVPETTTFQIPDGPSAWNPEPGNTFYNPNNNSISYGDLAVRPYKLYYADGYLFAECFLVNGKETTAYNLNMELLRFKTPDGVFAEDNFGVLNDVTIAPMSYIVITFRFDNPEYVSLQTIGWESDISFSH